VRDAASAAILESLGVENVEFTADAVWQLVPRDGVAARRILEEAGIPAGD
jgi:polysaccharide pyruvyl transferase WcaK-like protein